MPYDKYLPLLEIERIRDACFEKALANPELAGSHRSRKGGRVPFVDWRCKVFCHAADCSSVILAYAALPHIIPVCVGDITIQFPVDFEVTTRRGTYLVAFDVPGLEPHEHGLLCSLAASACEHPLVHITDDELDEYVAVGRFPSARNPIDGFQPGHAPPPRHL